MYSAYSVKKPLKYMPKPTNPHTIFNVMCALTSHRNCIIFKAVIKSICMQICLTEANAWSLLITSENFLKEEILLNKKPIKNLSLSSVLSFLEKRNFKENPRNDQRLKEIFPNRRIFQTGVFSRQAHSLRKLDTIKEIVPDNEG